MTSTAPRSYQVAAALVMFLAGAVARAADPAGGAAPGPVAGPNDPRSALRQLYKGIEAADPAAVEAALYAATPAEKDLAQAYVRMLVAARRLGQAAQAKFNLQGDALTKGLPTAADAAALDKATPRVTGNTAEITSPGQANPIKLVKVEGRWRVAIAEYAGVTPKTAPAHAQALRDFAEALEGVAGDIEAGRVATAPDAQQALQKVLQAVVHNTLRKVPPATRPTGPAATRPATTPAATRPAAPPAGPGAAPGTGPR